MHTYMLIKYTFLIIFSFFIASCGNESSFIEHEQKVYKALLSHMGGDDAKLLVIKEESVQEHRLSADEFLKEKNEIEAYREYAQEAGEASQLVAEYEAEINRQTQIAILGIPSCFPERQEFCRSCQPAVNRKFVGCWQLLSDDRANF